MGTEKILALYQSWGAMWWETYMSQIALVQSVAMAAMSSVTGAGNRARLSTVIQKVATRVLFAGLSLFHKKTVANAKRLSRRRK